MACSGCGRCQEKRQVPVIAKPATQKPVAWKTSLQLCFLTFKRHGNATRLWQMPHLHFLPKGERAAGSCYCRDSGLPRVAKIRRSEGAVTAKGQVRIAWSRAAAALCLPVEPTHFTCSGIPAIQSALNTIRVINNLVCCHDALPRRSFSVSPVVALSLQKASHCILSSSLFTFKESNLADNLDVC